jgi:hypothetical protein
MESAAARRGSEKQMTKNRRTFEFAARQVMKARVKGELEDSAEWCSVAASFAWHSHPGFFVDDTIQKILQDIGHSIDVAANPSISPENRPNGIMSLRILHVMTSAPPIGGHTRAVSRWIQNSRETYPGQIHELVITNQGIREVPRWLIDAVRESGGECRVIRPGRSLIGVAKELRKYSQQGFDLIVSHMNPNDPVSAMAFSGGNLKTPILLFNHADHVFSTATSVADVILDFRLSGKRITETRRGGKDRSMLLPIPLVDPMKEIGTISFQRRKALREEARERLGLSKDEPIALIIGGSQKYKPALGYDFLRAASKILASVRSAKVFAVGLPKDQGLTRSYPDLDERFHALGVVDDSQLRDHLLSADVYLEIFPFSSLTAMLEAGLYGLPMQRIRNERATILSGDDVSLDPVVPAATSEEEYVEGATRLLLSDAEDRHELGQRIRNSVLSDHCGAAWTTKWLEPAIGAALARNDKRTNETAAVIREESPSEECIELAEWERILYPDSLLDSLGMCYYVSSRVKWPILLYSIVHFGPLLRSYLTNPQKSPIEALIEMSARVLSK